LSPTKTDVVIDFGSGFGHFALFGAAAYESKFLGIELVSERVKYSQIAAQNLELKKAEFICGNLLEPIYKSVSAIFCFNPVYKENVGLLVSRIRSLALRNNSRMVISQPLAGELLADSKFRLQQVFFV